MKRIINILVLCVTLASLYSCSNETIITMDNSAVNKVDKVINGYIDELSSARYGWIAEVSTNQGYYFFHMTFTDDNMVTMYTDNTMYPEYNARPKTSTYNIRSMQRPTLCFDTYNYISIICDPDDSVSGGFGNVGLETDFEFEIDRFENEVFHLVGRINQVDARLRKATAFDYGAVTEGALMNTLSNVKNYNHTSYNYFTSDDLTATVLFYERYIDLTWFSDDDSGFTAKYTLPRMNYDVDLVEPIALGDKSLTSIDWDSAEEKFYAVVDGQKCEVKASSEAVIPLNKILGPGCRYTMLYTLPGMFAQSSNPFYLLFDALVDVGAYDASMYFDKENEIRLTLDISGYLLTYTYQTTTNEDGSFTVTGYNYGDDVSGKAEAVDLELGSESLIRYFVNRTFTIEWSEKIYDGLRMAEFKEQSDNTIKGVFFSVPFS